MSESEPTTDGRGDATPHDRDVAFDHPQKHAMLAMRDGADIAVWMEYDGKRLAHVSAPERERSVGDATMNSPTTDGENIRDLPDGYAAVLWSNTSVGDAVYCFGCETLYESDHEANTHHDPHTCEPFTPAVEVVEREVPSDE